MEEQNRDAEDRYFDSESPSAATQIDDKPRAEQAAGSNID